MILKLAWNLKFNVKIMLLYFFHHCFDLFGWAIRYDDRLHLYFQRLHPLLMLSIKFFTQGSTFLFQWTETCDVNQLSLSRFDRWVDWLNLIKVMLLISKHLIITLSFPVLLEVFAPKHLQAKRIIFSFHYSERTFRIS